VQHYCHIQCAVTETIGTKWTTKVNARFGFDYDDI